MTDASLSVTVAVLLAVALEWAIREPPADYHPVSLFGRIVEYASGREYATPKAAGTALAVGLPLMAAAVVYGVVSLAAAILPAVGVGVVAGLTLWVASSLGLLVDLGSRVIEASNGDVETARETLPALVGRNVETLSPPLVRSAAIESLAENLSDGLVAPLVAFLLASFISLPAAAAAATYVKAVNTMDSMLGYPGEFGWASARLDDAVMFVPARLTALLVGPAAGDPDAPLRARRYARVPASPNAGWPMGALAAALNVRLEKPGEYVLNEVADYPSVGDGKAAIAAIRRAGVAAYGVVAVVGVIRWL